MDSFTYKTKLANIIVPYKGKQYGMIVDEGSTATSSSDSGALYIKALTSKVESNPSKLDIMFNKPIDPNNLSFFVNKIDNSYDLKKFVYSGSGWTYNNASINLEKYGLTVTGNPSNGTNFTVRYSLRDIVSVKGTLKDSTVLKTISKTLVKGPKKNYTVQGPLYCDTGKYFSLYTLAGAQFDINIDIAITGDSSAGWNIVRWGDVSDSSFWRLGITKVGNANRVVFTNKTPNGTITHRFIGSNIPLNDSGFTWTNLHFYSTSKTSFYLEVNGVRTLLQTITDFLQNIASTLSEIVAGTAVYNAEITNQTVSTYESKKLIFGGDNVYIRGTIVLKGTDNKNTSNTNTMTVKIKSGKKFYSEESY